MQSFYVINILIDRPHIKRALYLPVWVRHVTGVMFFPVLPPLTGGVPDGEPIGVASLSLQNERLNVATNIRVYRKSPMFYESNNYNTGGGAVFLDRGYGAYDFFACNDVVTPNSFAVFKYVNRKMIKSYSDTEIFNSDLKKLKSLVGKNASYDGYVPFVIGSVEERGIYIYVKSISLGSSISFTNINLHKNLYKFSDPETGKPFFSVFDADDGSDPPFTMKIILRHEIE
jgi:hypothetical protein